MHIANTTKFMIQKLLRSFGWEMRRFELSDIAFIVDQLQVRGITEVLDVGANQGQYGAALYSKGFRGCVVSFEPLPEAHHQLCEQAERQPGWSVHPPCAIGARAGRLSLNVSENLVSSSLLPILDSHIAAAGGSRYVAAKEVDVLTLDSLPEYWRSKRAFLKIDTQGYEMEVLRGAREALQHVEGVQLEISLTALYDGQPDCMELLALLRSRGFSVWNVCPGFREPASSRLLQLDAVFFRNG